MFHPRQNVNILINSIRQIHLCTKSCSTNKQARTLAKLMTGSRRRRKNWCDVENQVRMPLFVTSKSFQEGPLKKNRTDVLNKLLMRSITDLLSTGEVTTDLIGRGLSITRVKTSPDFSVVNVYWTSKETLHDIEFEKVLQKAACDLHHELCQLHVLGIVPRICFVSDKKYNLYQTIDLCLEELRARGDLEAECCEELLSEPNLETSLDPNILERIQQMEKEEIEAQLPEMTNDIFGLDHSKIMNKINTAVVKSEAQHRFKPVHDGCTTEERKISSVAYSQNEGIYDVAKYIAKQKIQKKKMLRAQNRELLKVYADNKSISNEDEDIDLADGDFIEEFEDISRNGKL